MSKTGGRTVDFRFEKCPRCGNQDFSPEAAFCKRCGAPRSNECGSEECGYGQPLDAAYCELCGHETGHFMLGLIDDWQGPHEAPAPTIPSFEEDEVPF